MAHRLRWYLTGVVYEVTIRTLGGAFWLRPDAACRAIIEGVFGKALKLYEGVFLHSYDAQSNHLHYLISAARPELIPYFLDYVHSNIARQINELRGREGVFWSRRGSVIAVVDGPAQIDRLRYILAQGPKAGLVASPADWPGASSTAALLGDMQVKARYTSLDARRRNSLRPAPRSAAELEQDVAFTLSPLPVWAHLDADALRSRHEALVADIVAEHAGARFMGAKRLASQDPNACPASFHRSNAPRCHASSRSIRKRFLAAYDTFRSLYKAASERFRDSAAARTDRERGNDTAARLEVTKQYPPGALVRPRWYSRAAADLTSLWIRGVDDADLALA